MTTKNKTETDTEIIFGGDLILEADFKTTKKLIVHGDIKGKDGSRWNIDAGNINAMDIDAGNINARNINVWDINAWDIDAGNIDARNINAMDIDAWNINAWDINAWDINAWDIDAGNIDAWDIVCETRIKKSETAKTKARIYIKNKSQIERKEYEHAVIYAEIIRLKKQKVEDLK